MKFETSPSQKSDTQVDNMYQKTFNQIKLSSVHIIYTIKQFIDLKGGKSNFI